MIYCVEHIKKMLQIEERIINREKKEVTSDPALVEAEIRAGCLREVVKILDEGEGENGKTQP